MDSGKYLASLIFVLVVCNYISSIVLVKLNIGTFLLMAIIITVIFNGVYVLLYGRTEEFKYLTGKVKEKLL